jgi:hypothetical protein
MEIRCIHEPRAQVVFPEDREGQGLWIAARPVATIPIWKRRAEAMSTRLNVNINDETAEALRQLAKEENTTVTEVVRRAVSVYKFFEDAKDSGQAIQLVDNDEKVTTVQLV